MSETELQKQSRQRIQFLSNQLRVRSHQVVTTRNNQQQTQQNLQQLEVTHPEWSVPDFRRTVGFVAMLLFLVAVYILDYFLFSATAEYLVGQGLRAGEWLIELAKILTPASIIMLEVYISVQLHFAREEAAEYGNRRPLIGWLTIGVILALVMPCAAVATSLATQIVTGETAVSLPFHFLTASLGALALTAHICVLFGGRPAHSAKAHALFRYNHRKTRRRLNQLEGTSDRQDQAVAQTFTTYVNTLRRHNSMFTPHIAPGPFDEITRRETNRIFAGEVIQAPNSTPGNPETPVSPDLTGSTEPPEDPPFGRAVEDSPSQPPGDQDDGEIETDEFSSEEIQYYRALLERRIREADNEVTP
ncbi:hypothetical protein ACFL41_00195 [Gemmatimonadota bacterium]